MSSMFSVLRYVSIASLGLSCELDLYCVYFCLTLTHDSRESPTRYVDATHNGKNIDVIYFQT